MFRWVVGSEESGGATLPDEVEPEVPAPRLALSGLLSVTVRLVWQDREKTVLRSLICSFNCGPYMHPFTPKSLTSNAKPAESGHARATTVQRSSPQQTLRSVRIPIARRQ